MSKSTKICLALALSSVIGSAALADNSRYSANRSGGTQAYAAGSVGLAFGGEVGNDFVDFDLEGGVALAAAAGFYLSRDFVPLSLPGRVRVEGEVSYRENEFEVSPGEEISVWGFMANAWYDFNTGRPFVPYAGFGLGLGNGEIDDEDDTGFAFQFGGGLKYYFSDTLYASGDYRYFGANFDEDDLGFEDFRTHQLMATVGVNF